MDKRLKEINKRLIEYSKGNFDKRIVLSQSLDEMDAISSGINMLGEELKAITISRNYFTNIFNTVSDMVFILNKNGIIEDANKAAEDQLQYQAGTLIGKPVYILQKSKLTAFKQLTHFTDPHISLVANESRFYRSDGIQIPVRISIGYLNDKSKKKRILLTASDISFRIKTENLLIRAIIDTQEKERQRLAKDLHDSLTQQLSAIKFYISTTAKNSKSISQRNILYKSNEALAELIIDIRNICFNLMPATLQEFGLVKAVKEFCSHFLYQHTVKFNITQKTTLPPLSQDVKIDLYRVIQELITNAVKHGEAKRIKIFFNQHKNKLEIQLTDNGKGFDPHKASAGMGLQNVKSRVKSHQGELNIISALDKGTLYKIVIPIDT